jgi:hypothetical protein
MDKMKPLRPMKPMAALHSNPWWPSEFGTPTTSGSTEHLRYAYFPAKRRLVIDRGGKVAIYDTGEYQFRGALQAGGTDKSSLTFMTQRERVSLEDLKVVNPPASN